jgi:hypothetical protein
MILSTEIMKPFQPQTIIEPFRVRSVEPIRFTTMAEREAALTGRRLQSIPAARRRCADRPADRQRHRRDVLARSGRA